MVMRDYIKKFPKHIEHAIEIYESIDLCHGSSDVENIVISGQGGSAIGGVIIKNLLRDTLSVPIIVNQDYSIPSFVNNKTLFIASSYSGNTEETLSALKAAEMKNSIIFSITSGGDLLDISKEKGYNHIIIPSGAPPRAMLCYSIVQLLFVISELFGLSKDNLKHKLLDVQKYLIDYQSQIILEADVLVDQISNKMPFIYAFSNFEGVALRFKQQLNENSKRHACYNLIPEMNHNEIVPWINKHSCVFPVFLNGKTSSRNLKRMRFSIERISKNVDSFIELKKDELDYFTQYFYFIHLLDWVSLILAEKEKINPNDISLIDDLKRQLKNT